MTREEALDEVKNYENYPNGLSKECRDYILKALEQEPVIDKIRAEIEQARYGLINDGLDVALQIIDKYKAEQE